MSGAAVGALVALAFGVLVVRRRSLATWLFGAQSLLLGVIALGRAEPGSGLLIAAAVLLVRGVALPALLVFARRRTPEASPVPPATGVIVRLLAGVAVASAALAAVPPLGLGDPTAERGAIVLLCLGLTIVAMRRPALLQVLGLLVAENGVYLLALSVVAGLPFVIELGVVFDLVLVVTVAAAFAHRMHGELGSGDTDLLRRLRG